MSAEVTTALIALGGAVFGAVATATVNFINQRSHQRETRAAEQRAREAALQDEKRARAFAATARVGEALSKLLLLERDPDYDRDSELAWRISKGEDYEAVAAELGPSDEAAIVQWRRVRDDLVMVVDVALLDIGDSELRSRLDEVCKMLRLYGGPEKYARQREPRTRHIAARHGLDCIGSFRRSDSLPDRPEDYVNTLDLVCVYMDELESNSRR